MPCKNLPIAAHLFRNRKSLLTSFTAIFQCRFALADCAGLLIPTFVLCLFLDGHVPMIVLIVYYSADFKPAAIGIQQLGKAITCS